MSYECPLCSTGFESATCRSSCPIARGCAMVRCPRCGYEFVESGRIVDLLRRWIRRGPKQTCAQPPSNGDGVVRLIDLDLGASGSVVFIAPSAGSRVARLAAYGIVAGTELRLIARKPTVVLESGSTTIAVEPEIGQEIFVRDMERRPPAGWPDAVPASRWGGGTPPGQPAGTPALRA